MTKEEIRFAIDYLNKMMPEWDYEANVYCADAYHGLGELICDKPEGYVFKTAIEALENVDKYKWHDLRKNPDDLPNDDRNVEICYKFYKVKLYHTAYYDYEYMKWFMPMDTTPNETFENVIAWRDIEPFEVKHE